MANVAVATATASTRSATGADQLSPVHVLCLPRTHRSLMRAREADAMDGSVVRPADAGLCHFSATRSSPPPCSTAPLQEKHLTPQS